MNATAINFSIPTLIRMLTVAIVKASWNLTKRTTVRAILLGDYILRMTGWISIIVAMYTAHVVMWLHARLTSRVAMRRYKRWAQNVKRWTVNTYHWIDYKTTRMGNWMMHVFYLRGSLGQITFDVDDENRDGYVVVREFGDARNVPFNFWCENRWIIERGLNGRNMIELHTAVMDAGYNVAKVVLGEKKLSPYAKLPEVQLPETMSWKPNMELPDPRRFAPADILTRVA